MVLMVFSILSMVFIDLLSKYLIDINLVTTNATASFIPNLIQFKYVHNYGASFSILFGKQLFLVIVTSILILTLTYLLFSGKFKLNYEKVSFCMIIAGGIGNLIDRVAFGYVRDFFDLQFMNFAVFNVADCFVVVGVVIYAIFTVYLELKNYKEQKSNATK